MKELRNQQNPLVEITAKKTRRRTWMKNSHIGNLLVKLKQFKAAKMLNCKNFEKKTFVRDKDEKLIADIRDGKKLFQRPFL